MKKKIKKSKKEKPIDWAKVYEKAQELEKIRKVDELKYHVRALYELLFNK